MRLTKKNTKKEISFRLFILPIIITIIGVFFIFEASSVNTLRNFGDSFYYLKQQTFWLILAIIAMIFFSVFDYHKLYYISFPILLFSLFLLLIVLIPGIGYSAGGARRWINLGFTNLQPAELSKFAVLLYLSSWFLYKERERFFSYLLLMGLIIGLIMMQPDMGTAMINLGLFLAIYFFAGLELQKLFLLIPVLITAAGFLIKSSPYRLKRYLAFLNPDLDPQGITYHVNQVLISLSSGGFFGRGFGESRQKYQFLPEAHTDSIFAIIGEEVGFLGCLIIICLLVYLVFTCFKVVESAKDKFGQLLASGIFSLLILQITINLASMVGLMPLTGVPLPFLSYGGSNLLIFFSLMGILINIQRQSKN